MSAWANSHQLILGQRKVNDKSNEITAVPELLKTLFLEDCVVTIDAMGCQKSITQEIINKKADYILAVGNQQEPHGQVMGSFKILSNEESSGEIRLGHGRMEKRTCSVITDLSLLTVSSAWEKLNSLVLITERANTTTLVTGREERHYINSLRQSAKAFNSQIRSHWGIENSLHWILDVSFGEDKSRREKATPLKIIPCSVE